MQMSSGSYALEVEDTAMLHMLAAGGRNDDVLLIVVKN